MRKLSINEVKRAAREGLKEHENFRTDDRKIQFGFKRKLVCDRTKKRVVGLFR